jgi:hypothetical protein
VHAYGLPLTVMQRHRRLVDHCRIVPRHRWSRLVGNLCAVSTFLRGCGAWLLNREEGCGRDCQQGVAF